MQTRPVFPISTSVLLRVVFLGMFMILGAGVYGQKKYPKSPTAKFLHQRDYVFPDVFPDSTNTKSQKRWPDTLYYNTPYRAVLLGSPTIPFSFSRAEFSNGKYQITPTVSIGYGYTWFFGDFIFSENDKILVDPTFFFGVIGDISLQNDFNLRKPTGFMIGGFIGTSAFSLFGGFDLITHSPSIGVGSRIDVYTLSQKRLRPFGKVRELRGHKHIARPISDE